MLQIRHAASNWYWNYQWVKQFYGTENDLNHILSTFVDSEHEIATFCDSSYIAISDIQSIIKKHDEDLSILSLNTKSINAKFDKIYAIVNNLSIKAVSAQSMEGWLYT